MRVLNKAPNIRKLNLICLGSTGTFLSTFESLALIKAKIRVFTERLTWFYSYSNHEYTYIYAKINPLWLPVRLFLRDLDN